MDSKYFPFERNHYFYGKLLTVRDFESEQRYHSAKRRLTNRLLFGTGVAAGLQVIMVDDTSVSVQAGVAFDDLGREVVLPESRTLKLSMVDGFRKSDNATNLYLCVAFAEIGKEPVQPVANPAIQSDEVSEYNRLLESVRFFIKDDAPGPMAFEYNRLMETAVTIFENDALRITQIAPRYVEAGTVFDVRLIMECALRTPRIDFQFQLDSTVFTLHGHDNALVRWIQQADERAGYQEVTYRVEAPKAPQLAGIRPQFDSVSLHIGDDALVVSPDFGNDVEIVDDATHDHILSDYFNRSVDDAFTSTSDHAIYLGKISLVQAGPTYMIQQVSSVPHADKVYSLPLLHRLATKQATMLPSVSVPAPEQPVISSPSDEYLNLTKMLEDSGVMQGIGGKDRVTTGVVEIDLIPRTIKLTLGKLGKGYYSPEIEHGLGDGPVSIHTVVEEVHEPNLDTDPDDSDERIYAGALDVFADSQYQSSLRSVALGTVQFPKRGTFIVGTRVSNLTDQMTMKVRWWAIKKAVNVSHVHDAQRFVAPSDERDGRPS